MSQPREQHNQQQQRQHFSLDEAANLLLDTEHLDCSPAALLDESFALFAQTSDNNNAAPSANAQNLSVNDASSRVAIAGAAEAPDGNSSLVRATAPAAHEEPLENNFGSFMVPSDRDAVRHFPAALGGSRGRPRDGVDGAAAGAAFAAPRARWDQPQHGASAAPAEAASATDVEQWLLQRALEEVSAVNGGGADATAAMADSLPHIPLDLLQQSADAALFAQLQMLSSSSDSPFDTAVVNQVDFHDAPLFTRPAAAVTAPSHFSSRNRPMAGPPVRTAGRPSAPPADVQSPRFSASGSVEHTTHRLCHAAHDGVSNRSRNYPGSSLPRPGDVNMTTESERTAPPTYQFSGSFPPAAPAAISPRAPPHGIAPSAAAAASPFLPAVSGSAPAAPSSLPLQCSSSKLALEMLQKLKQGGGVLGAPMLSAPDGAPMLTSGAFAPWDAPRDVKAGVRVTGTHAASSAAPDAQEAAAASAAATPATAFAANAAAALAAAASGAAGISAGAHRDRDLMCMGGADASGALLIGSRPGRSGARAASTGAGELAGEGKGSAGGSTQCMDTARTGASGAEEGAAAAAAAGAAAVTVTPVTSGGQGGAGGPATSAAASGGGAGVSNGLSAEDDWRPRSRTRFDAEAMKRGEIKPRSMKERRRRDKISEGLRQLRQAIPESLLGPQQDMGAMIEAAVLHISNLQARVSKLERGAAIEKLVGELQP
ncbi:hypothetical protein CLOM_g8903 [Closterium sp. NIES-68]|nr:hypothetical protein CLOM_g22468 [Closterium sp. NIES-68]GJP49727.1 hypothetical protein CLOM_g8903 [Closterium sp. NIES-68]GJP70178.1 hypothetical protein CLOP_g1153 [Closterium sp. NIES-67]